MGRDLYHYVSDFIDKHIDFDRWKFCVRWATRIWFLPVLSAVFPSINSFPWGTARSLLLNRPKPSDCVRPVSLADTGPCKYTTLYSKALLILFSTSDNTLLNLCLYISLYLTSINSRLIIMHASMISGIPTIRHRLIICTLQSNNCTYFHQGAEWVILWQRASSLRRWATARGSVPLEWSEEKRFSSDVQSSLGQRWKRGGEPFLFQSRRNFYGGRLRETIEGSERFTFEDEWDWNNFTLSQTGMLNCFGLSSSNEWMNFIPNYISLILTLIWWYTWFTLISNVIPVGVDRSVIWLWKVHLRSYTVS